MRQTADQQTIKKKDYNYSKISFVFCHSAKWNIVNRVARWKQKYFRPATKATVSSHVATQSVWMRVRFSLGAVTAESIIGYQETTWGRALRNIMPYQQLNFCLPAGHAQAYMKVESRHYLLFTKYRSRLDEQLNKLLLIFDRNLCSSSKDGCFLTKTI